jgi:hypothetical protein
MKRKAFICLVASFLTVNAFLPYNASCQIHKGRLIGVLSVQGAIYLGTFGGLYFLWYKNYPHARFHFFNDNNEWQQMDKCGHATTAYNISLIGYSSYRWAGMDQHQSAYYGGLLGFLYLLNVEILDGFSSQWGFSPGDLAANTVGAAIFLSQQLAWNEQKFTLKFSFHPTVYAGYNPGELGKNFIQQMLKDYNGQSYWISCNISSFLPHSSDFPKWLNADIGYGASGMTGAVKNIIEFNGQPAPSFQRYRKFFISADADLIRIPTNSPTLQLCLPIINFIKIPLPTLEYNTLKQFKPHWLYY